MKISSHLGIVAFLAKKGFYTPAIEMIHREKGRGHMVMDTYGMFFQPFDGSEAIEMTWEEISDSTEA